MQGDGFLSQPLTVLSGIGSRLNTLFNRLGIYTVQDLLLHRPIRYEDRTRIIPLRQLRTDSSALVCGHVQFVEALPRGRKSLICRIGDASGTLDLRFFHFTASQQAALKPGTKISCYGEVRFGYGGLEMVHPEYQIVPESASPVAEVLLTPVYPLTEGLSQSVIRKAVRQALALCQNQQNTLQDWLPPSLQDSRGFPSYADAVATLHGPDKDCNVEALLQGTVPEIRRLAFEELLAHHLGMKLSKTKAMSWRAPVFSRTSDLQERFISALPFQLTLAQQRVMAEIAVDLARNQPMMRLVQGDVGSGKTVVAAFAASLALASGYQVAVMAPTELLAEQHFRNFSLWFQDSGHQVELVTSQLRGESRKAAYQRLAAGNTGIAVGTHALFQDEVSFHRLGLIIIDEQHRFGVRQRLALRAKGEQAGSRPHQLIMTATPIPRTLAMLNYADLDLSVIDQLPPGRKPVTTSVVSNERRQEVVARIRQWIGKGRQAYWVCTLIEESELLQCEAAEKTLESLQALLPDIRIGLIHGRVKNSLKESAMRAFKNGDIDLLVATTVIEVGVDVPNASLMVIENPERLGLSQLHQLRGRVGRGSEESYCLLLYQPPLSSIARQRLGILRDSNDGFQIAEKDLRLRGPGEFMGTRQTGQVQFKIADLARDADLLDNIPEAAGALSVEAPNNIAPLIQRWLGSRSDFSEV